MSRDGINEQKKIYLKSVTKMVLVVLLLSLYGKSTWNKNENKKIDDKCGPFCDHSYV